MAKSLRSKFKRKMRAIKREKNYPRELKALKETLNLDKDPVTKETPSAAPSTVMETDSGPSKYSQKTMKDTEGKYPLWLVGRALKKQVRVNRRKRLVKRKTVTKTK